MTEKKDFLAISLIGVGSSYGRAETTHEAVSICKKCLEQDWKHLFQLDGHIAKFNVFDVTGRGAVYWDHRGVHPEGYPHLDIPLHHVATAKLSVPSQRKKSNKA